MAHGTTAHRDTSIRAYRAKRDFSVTAEPAPGPAPAGDHAPIFVVQKHHAHRAGLHWDFRLEHDGVLWSWAVRKGPSLDPADRRVAVHVEDHPLDYADFHGTIPEGQYGAGAVETWDRGTWAPLGDPAAGLRDGEVRFVLNGRRLHGHFTLVRLRPRPDQRGRQEHWLLIKGRDEQARAGADAAALEAATDPPAPAAAPGDRARDDPPARGAKRGPLPVRQEPQLAAVAEEPPTDGDWISEVKFDGYRLLAWRQDGQVRLVTRNGHDWTDRLPSVARALGRIDVTDALFDGELVALDRDGFSSFPDLQAALSGGHDETLFLYLFDLLHLDGWDLRPAALRDRKRLLAALHGWGGMLRYSDHHDGDTARMRRQACRMKLEGIICKQADAPYQPGRGHGWVKVKCQGREELVVLGWTPPRGARAGIGALHLGYYDENGDLHYAGGVGAGFSDDELDSVRRHLDRLHVGTPPALLVAGDPLPKTIHWVRPERVVETSFITWTAAGRVRQAVYLGLREDKAAHEVVRPVVNPAEERRMVRPRQPSGGTRGARHAPVLVEPPKPAQEAAPAAGEHAVIVTARAPRARTETVEGVTLTHPDRALWPGITKRDLAAYWQSVAPHALPGLVRRPLAILRCPDGTQGEHFFQKHGHGGLPDGIREGQAEKAPFLAIDDLRGLIAMVQISAVELHPWGATEADPLHPDRIVFDLDPGEGVPFTEVVAAARDVRRGLEKLGLQSFCRTTGGKGLHVVLPLDPVEPWEAIRTFSRTFAQALSEAEPDRFLPTLRKVDRRGRILIDWLRNGMGATAIASFCPRARPGATVATPLAWREVTRTLDPAMFTVKTVPERLARLRADPWEGFAAARQRLPQLASSAEPPAAEPAMRRVGKTTIVHAKPPKRR